jgi:hypothetical protein
MSKPVKIDTLDFQGRTYKVGDKIHLYKDDEGFKITGLERAHNPAFGKRAATTEEFIIVCRGEKGSSTYVYKIGDGFVGKMPLRKKVETS